MGNIMQLDWIDLSEHWEELTKLARLRDNQKKNYKSTKNWSKDSTHLLGLIGELCFSINTGLKIDKTLKVAGDDGYDFIHNGKTYDIKTTSYYSKPNLIQNLNPKKWADYYILVGVNMSKKTAKIFGYATKEELQNAELYDYGYGNRRVIEEDGLNKGLPKDILGVGAVGSSLAS
jgi:hypothetical protein